MPLVDTGASANFGKAVLGDGSVVFSANEYSELMSKLEASGSTKEPPKSGAKTKFPPQASANEHKYFLIHDEASRSGKPSRFAAGGAWFHISRKGRPGRIMQKIRSRRTSRWKRRLLPTFPLLMLRELHSAGLSSARLFVRRSTRSCVERAVRLMRVPLQVIISSECWKVAATCFSLRRLG